MSGATGHPTKNTTNGHGSSNGDAVQDGQTNSHSNGTTAVHDDIYGPAIEQAMTLRVWLRDALGRTHDLIGALKRQKEQSRLVASTLASLKQLQAA